MEALDDAVARQEAAPSADAPEDHTIAGRSRHQMH
jgi:hypothetical protein